MLRIKSLDKFLEGVAKIFDFSNLINNYEDILSVSDYDAIKSDREAVIGDLNKVMKDVTD